MDAMQAVLFIAIAGALCAFFVLVAVNQAMIEQGTTPAPTLQQRCEKARAHFSVVHHASTERYYPRHHGHYMTPTAWLNTSNDLVYAYENMEDGAYFSTSNEAWKLIDRFIEQHGGNVQIHCTDAGW